ncbi:glycerophosphodiester phosphodiesterase [Noviherbaspirillum denitrificans]|uniref:Glycerophosphodiester phosphodiesterase n=1 Tax=Noviherbaspirillum denitrificans TaxID=1968433 RepID=A0A254TAK3_9BURK|nr:glycerophosphodiester phosphodiesterase [Noviherbaspirillum denitrificans]OWW19680.1 glycerophosphodiester phosphodiesterase [Noviherbaspirillum denitrificans]
MWFYPKVLAHRGGGTLAPENTLAALRCGLRHGYRAVEFDVMLSKDSIPVLMHDSDFGRTVRGRGRVADTRAADLARLDAGSWFGAGFTGEPVPTYEQAVNFCKANGIWMNVEIKPSPGAEAETGRVVGEFTRRLFDAGDALPPLFSSFSFDALVAAKAAAPGIRRGFLADVIPPDWLDRLQALDAVALHTNQKHLLPERARAVKDAGYGLFCYTVNTPELAREILGWGVDAFCTDRIDLIGPDFAAG